MKPVHLLPIVLAIFLNVAVRCVVAQPALTPEAAKSFIDFYYHGQGDGVVLADTRLCTEVEELQCKDPIPPNALQVGTTYYYWMMFVVPQNDEVDDIIVQFDQGGVTRSTAEVSLKGSIRYRTWKGFTPRRAGNWEIRVLHDVGPEVRTVRTETVTVNE